MFLMVCIVSSIYSIKMCRQTVGLLESGDLMGDTGGEGVWDKLRKAVDWGWGKVGFQVEMLEKNGPAGALRVGGCPSCAPPQAWVPARSDAARFGRCGAP